jgi:hypothetical protein
MRCRKVFISDSVFNSDRSLEIKRRSTETSIILLDKSFFLNILVKKFSKKGGERKPSSYFAKCLLQNEGRMPVRKVRGRGGDKKEEGWANN